MTQSCMSMKMTDLQDLSLEQLRDVYSAETQLLDALPKMVQRPIAEGEDIIGEKAADQKLTGLARSSSMKAVG